MLRLWRRLAAVALIRPLAWEPPYATGAVLKRPKKKKKAEESDYEKSKAGNNTGVNTGNAKEEMKSKVK